MVSSTMVSSLELKYNYCTISDHGRPLLAIADHCWPLPASAGHCRPLVFVCVSHPKFQSHFEFEVEILLLRVGLHVPQGDDFAFLHSTHNVRAHGLSLRLKVLESSQINNVEIC